MSRRHLALSASIAMLASFFAAGCGPDAKDKRINELSAELDRLRNDLAERDNRLNDMTGRDEDAQRSVRDLNREIADLRDRLAKAQSAPPTVSSTPVTMDAGDGKWVSLPGFDMISIPGEVLFDSGKATVRPAGKQTLDRIASDIRSRYPDRDIYVFGHTDDQPIRKSGWKDNWQLGAERALAAARHLIGAGVPPTRVIQANRGEFQPRVANANDNARRQNRRVEFYAVIRRGGGSDALGAVGTDTNSSTAVTSLRQTR